MNLLYISSLFINDCKTGTLENQIKQAFAEIKSLVKQSSSVIYQMDQQKQCVITYSAVVSHEENIPTNHSTNIIFWK